MSEDVRPITVEFLGLPGAGKSSLAHRVAGRLAQAGLRVEEPVRLLSDRSGVGPSLRGYLGKVLRIARELVARPRSSFRVVRAIGDTGQPTAGTLVRIAANWLMQCAVLRSRAATPAVLLLDEGMLQALWSVGLEGREGSVRRLGDLLVSHGPVADVVVVIEADPQTVAFRLAARAGRESRADRWGPGDTRALGRATSIMSEVEEVLDELRACPRPPRVLRAENGPGADPEAVARWLAREIEALARGRARAALASGHEPGGQPGPLRARAR